MNRGSRGRTQACGRREARTRQAHARKFLEVADLAATEQDVDGSANVAGALAVLAGIAATDAACCAALGRRSRSQDHHDAETLVKDVDPDGPGAAKTLRRLLSLKDKSQYGLTDISGEDVRAALRHARHLVDFGDEVIRR
jgi:hypothetical protein